MIDDLYTEEERWGQPVIPGYGIDRGWEWPAMGLLLAPVEGHGAVCEGCGEVHPSAYEFTRADVPGVVLVADADAPEVGLLLMFGPDHVSSVVGAFFDGITMDALSGMTLAEAAADRQSDPARPDALTIEYRA